MGKDAEFLDAARTGNIQVVEKVLSSKTRRSGPLASLRRGPGANVQDSSGYTALHHAALNGHRSVVSLLLRHEASVNVQDDKGSTPLHLAAWAGHDHVIKVLLTQGPSIPHINHQNKGGDTALHFAAQYGHTETTRLLLKKRGDPTLPNLKAETPLDLAAQFGRFSIAELLLREANDLLRPFSVDVATAAVFPHTPLHLASRNGHLAVVKLLLNHGHHVNVRTSMGSPLHEAAICGKVDVVRALMEAGADSEVKNDLGHTVLDTIAAINTPVTQEISGLIRSHHARLIDFEDDPPFLIPAGSDEGGTLERNRTSSPSSSIATLPSFEFSLPPVLLKPTPCSPHASPTPSVPIAVPAPYLSSLGRPSSAPSNPFHSSVAFLRSDSIRSVSSSSSSPLSLPPSVPPSECGEVYENVLVPVRLYQTDGDNFMRTTERRPNSKRNSDHRDFGGGRMSGRESRLSDKDTSGGRLSDREGGRFSDYDGRASITSDFSPAVYDIPPPPSKVITSASDRSSSVSTRSNSAHDILEDENTYEIPPQPRAYQPILRASKELSDGEASKPNPPPKPPRRSVCPPSPTTDEGNDDRSYEMICFATTGERKSTYENSGEVNKLAKGNGNHIRSRSREEGFYKTIGHPARRGRKYEHTDTDTDSDSGQPRHYNSSSFHNNKGYTTMSFKPVKSRRTTKAHNTYENTIHRYENIRQHPTHKSVQQSAIPNSHYGNATSQRTTNFPPPNHSVSAARHLQKSSSEDPWNEGGSPSHRRFTHRAKSAHGSRLLRDGSDGSSDDSERGGRPKSLDFLMNDDTRYAHNHPVNLSHYAHPPTPDHPPPSAREAQIYIQRKIKQVAQGSFNQKKCSKDAETETDPEDSSLTIEVKSTGVGGSPPLPERVERSLNGEGSNGEVLIGRGESSCSLSSASVASLSDRSASTDNIEEVRSDIPFAGLFRGSRSSGDWSRLGQGQVMVLERPKSLTTSSSAFRPFERGCRNSFPSTKITSGSKGNINCQNYNNNNCKDAVDHHRGEKGGSVLSPLEEDEEWARISDIMASFGGGVARESVFMAELEQEFQQRLAGMSLSPSQQKLSILSKKSDSTEGADGGQTGVSESPPRDIGSWLKTQDLTQYEATFLAHGYDDVNFLNGLLDVAELEEMGVSDLSHREKILGSVAFLPPAMPTPHGLSCSFDTVEEWLSAIQLPQYVKVFRKHGFGEMERVRKIWEVELSVVLEVTLLGHRKRMLASLGDRPIEPELPASLAPQELSFELSKLNTDISELKEKLFHELPSSTCRERRPPETATNTIRKGTTKRRAAPPPPPKAPRLSSLKKIGKEVNSLVDRNFGTDEIPLRDPSQLVVGVPQTLLSEWKHHPTKLVTANIQYIAQYLGSTHVKELEGTDSTMKSIHKLRKSTADGAKVPSILLAVSYLGVRFIDASTQHVVCEHEIRNIHCACQDADDLCHFAYITKDIDTQGHYCHVFRVQSKDLATEIIMTLGEAFEVAYQLTLRGQQIICNQSDEQKLAQGHSRSKSEHLRNAKPNSFNGNHVRSHSTVGNQYPAKGTTAPNTSLENLLSDSGNFSDKDADSPYGRRESSSPSVDSSNSVSINPQHQQTSDLS